MANTVKVITTEAGTKVYTVDMLAVAGTFDAETLPVPPGYQLVTVHHEPVVPVTDTVTTMTIVDNVTDISLITDVTDLSQVSTDYKGLRTDGTHTTLGNTVVTIDNNAVAAANVVITLVYTNDI